MRLSELSAEVPQARVVAGGDVEVLRVVSDSRRARAGDLFVAIPGATLDGVTFVADALGRGAVAVATEGEIDLPPGVGLIVVPSARQALGDLANVLYGRPSEHLRLIGVTGTDGKTTTSQLIGHVLAAAGRRVGWMTTVDVRIGDELLPNPFGHTTPEASDVHELLARMVAAGVEDVVLEVSSHALALDRVRGCTFDVAVFTNLAPEHLNFHGSMEAYAEAKSRLFGMLDSPTQKDVQRFGVVNADDPASVVMVGASPAAIVSYALDYEADVRATELELGLGGTRFQLVSPIDELEVETRLVGRHNVYNWLAAACVALGWGIDLEAVVEAAASVEAPRGRMERVQAGQRFEVIVDFAHTPQALETTLRTLRDIALPSGSPWVSPPPRRFAPPQPSPVEGEGAGRVPPTSTGGIRPHPTPLPEGEGAGAHPWRGRAGVGGTFSPALYLVFGMAGGRDAANRPRMGELAARYAEFFVISTDDPIHEDPAQIAADVAAGARAAGAVDGEQFVVELDRRAAIELVLRRARPGDVVLLAGKGHEQRMLVGDRAEPWNDEAVARDILGEMGFE